MVVNGDMTQEDKPIAIILPNWNLNEPRFIVEDAHDGLADDRAFKNGKCVYNQRLGIVYTVEYVVDALNELGDEIDKLKEENGQLRQQYQRLYNYFRDYLEDEMSAENFGEMWDNVKEDERWNDE